MATQTDTAGAGFSPDGLAAAVDILDRGVPDLHDGYQLYVSRHGETVLDVCGGDAHPGAAMTPDTLMLWFSSSKPVTAVAVGLLWERGLIKLDDPVSSHVPGFAKGKETATIRHLLTHRGGFPFADLQGLLEGASWKELVDTVVSAPATFPPGSAAAYHATAGWVALGAVVEAVDGRRIDRFCREEIFEPLGMVDSYLLIPEDLRAELAVRCGWIDAKLAPDDPMRPLFDLGHLNPPGGLDFLSPGGSGRGPAHDLGRFYEMILGRGTRDGVRILSPQTTEALTAVARFGVADQILGMTPHPKWGAELPWGLGFVVQNRDMGPHASHRAVGHSGHASSTAFCDPEHGLVVAVITNGLPGFELAEERMASVCGAVYEAAGLSGDIHTSAIPNA